MKNTFLAILILSTYCVIAQETIIKELISFNTTEKNSKIINFSKKSNGNNIMYILTVSNKSTPEFSKCTWTTNLNQNEINYFLNALDKIEVGEEIINHNITLKYKKDKIYCYK